MPAADALAAFTACVGGNPAHVMSLLLDTNASEETGLEQARLDYQAAAAAEITKNLPPDQLAEVAKLLGRLSELMPGINDLLKDRE